jgi:acetyltransferase
MSTYRLQKLFCPRSVAIVGASPRERSLGRSIARNLRAGGFGGSLHIVNPNYEYIDGLSTVNSVEAIAEVPDIVVIAAPPAAVPEIVAAAGAKGAAAAIIITTGLTRRSSAKARTLRRR